MAASLAALGTTGAKGMKPQTANEMRRQKLQRKSNMINHIVTKSNNNLTHQHRNRLDHARNSILNKFEFFQDIKLDENCDNWNLEDLNSRSRAFRFSDTATYAGNRELLPDPENLNVNYGEINPNFLRKKSVARRRSVGSRRHLTSDNSASSANLGNCHLGHQGHHSYEIRASRLSQLHRIKLEKHEYIINVSGHAYRIHAMHLRKSNLFNRGKDSKRLRQYIVGNQVFLDRHRPSFEVILEALYLNKTILRPEEIPLDVFLEELKFYDLDDDILESYLFYEGIFDEKPDVHTPTSSKRLTVYKFVHVEKFPYERPYFWSQMYRYIGVSLIFVSLFIFSFESLYHSDKQMTALLIFLEEICDLWFFIEFLLHWYSCPNRLHFFIELETILDILALIPFMIYIFNQVHLKMMEGHDELTDQMILTIQSAFGKFRILHIIRICKLGKYSRGVKVLGKTIVHSRDVLTILGTMEFICALLFASFAFFGDTILDVFDEDFGNKPLVPNPKYGCDFMPWDAIHSCNGDLTELNKFAAEQLQHRKLIDPGHQKAKMRNSPHDHGESNDHDSEPLEKQEEDHKQAASSDFIHADEGVMYTVGFKSLLDAIYWAIITMTTVGYGDIVPASIPGQFIGALCSVFGVLAIAFPVPIVVGNFNYLYNLENEFKLRAEDLRMTHGKNKSIVNRIGGTADFICKTFYKNGKLVVLSKRDQQLQLINNSIWWKFLSHDENAPKLWDRFKFWLESFRIRDAFKKLRKKTTVGGNRRDSCCNNQSHKKVPPKVYRKRIGTGTSNNSDSVFE